MKKVLSIVLILALVFCMFACGDKEQGGDEKGDDTVYTFSISHIATSEDPIDMGWNALKELLETKSEGRIKVEIFGNKQLSNSNNEDFEKVMNNIVQATSVPTSTIASMADVKEYWVFEYPYLFETFDEFYKVLDADIAKTWSDKVVEKVGVKTYGGYTLGWCDVSSNNSMTKLADLKGLKIRTMQSDVQMAVVNAFGSNATVMNYGEVFTGCQQKTIDGIYTTTGLYVSDKFYEVQDYMICTEATSLLHVPCVNATWYNSLPEDLQKVFDDCMVEYLAKVRQFELDFDAAALKTLADKGMTIKTLTAEEKEEFKAATAGVIAEFADVAGQDTIDAVKAILGK